MGDTNRTLRNYNFRQSNFFVMKEIKSSLEKGLILGMGQEIYNCEPGASCSARNKGRTQKHNDGNISKVHKGQCERAHSEQNWNNLSNKIKYYWIIAS